MFYRLLLTFVLALICVWLQNSVPLAAGQSENTNEKPINDSILELYNNCTCVPYYLCDAANDYMLAARLSPIPNKINCTDKDLLCCKNSTTTVEPTTKPSNDAEVTTITTTTTTTTAAPANMTEEPDTRKWASNHGCGIAKTEIGLRILSPDAESAATIPGEIPWMAEIFQRRSTKKPFVFKCAGTLIHPKVVLTATHRIISKIKEPQAFKVVATGREVFQNLGVREEDERNVVQIIKHPGYYSGGAYNDLSLLVLDREYNFTLNLLNSICLPKANQSFAGRRCLAVGWGDNKDLKELPLKKVDVPVVEFQECQRLIRKTSLGPEFTLHSSFLCAGGEEGKDTCKGDGGGPLMCIKDDFDGFVQAGIVSWGPENKCGIVDQPGVYVDVGRFRGWVEEELKKIGLEMPAETV